MLRPYAERRYRPCVGIMLINRDGHVFVGQRIDQTAEAWQMPQGGIDDGETPLAAAWRELHEEVGTDRAELIAESATWLPYDLPPALADGVWRGRFRGQSQRWFAFRFTGTDADVVLDRHEPEFDAWRWTDADGLIRLAVPFKRDIYRKVVAEFGHLLA